MYLHLHLIPFLIVCFFHEQGVVTAIKGCPKHPVYLNGTIGSFTSPNYPANYSNNARCEWIIVVPRGYHIRLSFIDFNTESRYDRVYVTSNSTGLNRQISGTLAPFNIIGGQQIRVRFTSDGSVTSRGFRAYFSAIYGTPSPPISFPTTSYPPRPPSTTPPGCPGYPVYLNGTIGSFTSPNYPANYSNNARCEWIIVAPRGYHIRLSFIDFNTESRYDRVYVTSNSTGLNRQISGRLAPFNVIGGQQIRVRFTSDGSVTSRGFRAYFSAIYGTPSPPISFPTTSYPPRPPSTTPPGCPGYPVYLNGTIGSFTSPNYPANYPNNARCEWIIVAPRGYHIRLSFIDFNTESRYDRVYVTSNSTGLNRQISGRLAPFNIIGGQQIRVRFTSDGSVTSRGFRAYFSAIYGTPSPPISFPTTSYPPRPPSTTPPASGCPRYPIYLFGMNGTFTSPNYPGHYPINARCEWRIYAPYRHGVQLSFTDFDTERCCDYVEVISSSTGLYRKHRGSSLPPPILGGRVLVVRFRSDGSVNRRGFRAEYRAYYNSSNTTARPYTTMPTTAGPSLCPEANAGSCNFEGGFCGYENLVDDDLDWRLNQFGTPSSSTGPSGDHTTGSGFYMYTEASGSGHPFKKAKIMTSPLIRIGGRSCLTFYYHMYGRSMGTLRVFIGGNQTKIKVWELNGDQGNRWKKAQIPYYPDSSYKVVFEGITGDSFTSDMAIDDVRFTQDSHCYFFPSHARPSIPTTRSPWTTAPPLLRFNCTFDNSDCRIINNPSTRAYWRLHRGPTASGRPQGDHTTGKGRFYLFHSSRAQTGWRGRLNGPPFRTRHGLCLSFYYFMYGSQMGTLRVLRNNKVVWEISGNQGNQWIKAVIPIRDAGNQWITIEGVVGTPNRSDIAIDDFSLFEHYSINIYNCPLTPACATPKPPTSGPSVRPTGSYNGPCGVSSAGGSRVIGGVDAIPGAWPWQVGLHLFGSFWCGGSLIRPDWVVTAAHCIRTYLNASDYKVVLGDHNRYISEGSEQEIIVRRWIIHPRWSYRTGSNDIALLQLSRPARLNGRVRTVCLPQAFVNVPAGKQCFVTGWGKIRHPGSSHVVLQQALLPVVNSTYCQHKLNQSPMAGRRNITRAMVCGGEEGSIKSGCHGDSGGPYVCRERNGRWALQGVVSWGSPRCDARENFSVFARVSEFRAWIDRCISTKK